MFLPSTPRLHFVFVWKYRSQTLIVCTPTYRTPPSNTTRRPWTVCTITSWNTSTNSPTSRARLNICKVCPFIGGSFTINNIILKGSVLRRTDISRAQFPKAAYNELRDKLPTLFTVLNAAMCTLTKEPALEQLAFLYSIIMRQHNQQHNAYQRILTCVSLHSRASNEVNVIVKTDMNLPVYVVLGSINCTGIYYWPIQLKLLYNILFIQDNLKTGKVSIFFLQLLKCLYPLNVTLSDNSKAGYLERLARRANEPLVHLIAMGKGMKITVDNLDYREVVNQVRLLHLHYLAGNQLSRLQV